MQVDVVMPQMGESIAEGTITRWLKKVGDKVERDEPIFEISTDKVDAEIPSPSAGVLREIRNQEGETVGVNSVVAVIETDPQAVGTRAAAAPEREVERTAGEKRAAPAPPVGAAPAAGPASPMTRHDAAGRFVSPVVRRIAAEHGVDPATVEGSGAGGRVTKKDILAFIEAGAPREGATTTGATPPAERPRIAAALSRPAARTGAAGPPPAAAASQPDAPQFTPGEPVVHVPMTQMRKKIAEHMVESRRVAAHVHSVFEVDMTRVASLRAVYQSAYAERNGAKLTFMPFFIKAVCDGLRAWPILNSSVVGDDIVYKRELNIGIAVALDWGLIVPVIRRADELSLAGLAKRIEELAQRSRSKKLNPDEVQGGTFTLTNPGSFGGLYGLPIINQPQVAILGIGGIKKRPVVVDGDAIAIRSMVLLAMSYDHRVVDGAVADQFLARVQYTLENFDESLL
jgi:2-oxoglutarate dehydrogenase E2 component (dihydrolipoamide succinyltransferase)